MHDIIIIFHTTSSRIVSLAGEMMEIHLHVASSTEIRLRKIILDENERKRAGAPPHRAASWFAFFSAAAHEYHKTPHETPDTSDHRS
jgi:hypothetical protein